MSETDFRNPAATVDLLVENEKGEVLLIERLHEPYRNCWAIPGGFLDYGKETLEHAAVRELREETCLEALEKDLVLFGAYSDPKRDPRGHVISHAYVVTKYSGVVRAMDDAKSYRWFSLDDLPDMAFDHKGIMEDYMKWKRKE